MYVTKDTVRPRLTKEERDQQREKLYRAEREALNGKTKPLRTMEDVATFLDKVRGRKVLQKRFGHHLEREVRIKDGRGTRIARGGVSHISLPLWARNEFVVLHEFAHTLTARMQGSMVAGHGWQYANVYLQLVKSMLGTELHAALKESFKKHKVRASPKKTVTRTVEKTPELMARLARAREVKRQNVKPVQAAITT